MGKHITKILVVDDEPDVLRSFKSYLGRRGYSVFAASNGNEVLAIIKSQKPDLVLLDLKLQGISGKEILSQLREYDKNIKVVIITGDLLNEDEVGKIWKLGISEYLTKPISLEKLEVVIRNVLKGKIHTQIQPLQVKANESKYLPEPTLRELVHDLSNVIGIINNKVEEFLLNSEEGIYNGKNQKEMLDISTEMSKTVLKHTDRLVGLLEKLSERVKEGK